MYIYVDCGTEYTMHISFPAFCKFVSDFVKTDLCIFLWSRSSLGRFLSLFLIIINQRIFGGLIFIWKCSFSREAIDTQIIRESLKHKDKFGRNSEKTHFTINSRNCGPVHTQFLRMDSSSFQISSQLTIFKQLRTPNGGTRLAITVYFKPTVSMKDSPTGIQDRAFL